MGIPFFAKKITAKYPCMVLSSNRINCGRLFLDLNCAIHQCATMVLKSVTDRAKIEPEIIRQTIVYINKITKYARPSELVYIAVDGIAPRAKMSQQRKRRFISTWREREDASMGEKHWDTNAITPGTVFMGKLADALQQFGRSRPFNDVHVIVSDSNEPGEGEAKIVEYMRDNPAPKTNDVIYGLDADLIMLAMLSEGRVFLLREPAAYDMANSHLPFVYFDINALKNFTIKEYGYSSIDDYVVMCFFMGNDFVPPMSHLKIKSNGIDAVMAAHARVSDETGMQLVGKDPVTGKKCLNYMFLLRLLEALKDNEDAGMVAADEAYYKQRVGHNYNKIDNYPTFNKYPEVIRPSRPGWRRNYYYHLLNIQGTDDINRVCQNFMEGIEWTFEYYFHGCISRAWYYKYNYSPTILDLYNYLLTTMSEKSYTDDYFTTQIKKTTYPDNAPCLNLLMVLPPQSIELLPDHLRTIMTNVGMGCLHMYPTEFKIDTYIKQYLWECYPRLPPVDVCKLLAAAKRAEVSL